MLLARDQDKRRIEPTKGAVGFCDCCEAQLIPKCGRIKVHHWAHKAGDCDPWYEPESSWHQSWKRRAPKEWCEVTMGRHRADIRREDGLVIELQHSSLSPDDVEKREAFYQNMIWIVNAQRFTTSFVFNLFDANQVTFQWRPFPERWTFAKKTLYFHFGARIVEMIDRNGYYGAVRGIAHTRTDFLRWLGLNADVPIANNDFGIWLVFRSKPTGHEPKDMPIPEYRARYFKDRGAVEATFLSWAECQILFADGTVEPYGG